MTDFLQRHGRLGTVAIVAGLVVGIGVALLWGWNTLAVELFSAPRARFKHALAAELLLLAVGLLLGIGRRAGGVRRDRPVEAGRQ